MTPGPLRSDGAADEPTTVWFIGGGWILLLGVTERRRGGRAGER